MGTLPKRSILSAWFGRLPEEKAAVYNACAVELESGFNLLGITLNEGLRLKDLGYLRKAREMAALCQELAERHGRLLESVLRVVERESRHVVRLPDALPFEADSFRSPAARSSCFWNGLLHRVLFSSRTRWFHKLHSLQEILGEIAQTFRQTAEEVACGFSVTPLEGWETLETLHDDWNTCLRETVVLFKCLLDTAAPQELEGLRNELAGLRAAAERQATERPALGGVVSQGSRSQEHPCI